MTEPRDYNLMKRLPAEVVYKLTQMGYDYAEEPITIPMVNEEVKGIFYRRSGSLANNSGTYILFYGKGVSLAAEAKDDNEPKEYFSYYKYSFSEPGYIEVDHESISYQSMTLEKFFAPKER